MKPAVFLDKKLLFAGAVFALLVVSSLFFQSFLFPQKQYSVAVVGNASFGTWNETIENEFGPLVLGRQGLLDFLNAEDFKLAGIDPAIELRPDFVMPGTLDGFDTVIVYNATFCDRTTRGVLADYALSGGNLVVVGDSCTRVVDMPQSSWDIGRNNFSEVMPAEFEGTRAVDARLVIYDVDHPVFNGVRNYQLNGEIAVVKPAADARILAFINSSDVESGNALHAIFERKVGAGRVVYFAYDPIFSSPYSFGSRNLMLNLLLYLENRK